MTDPPATVVRTAVMRGPGEVAEDEAGEALAIVYARLREVLRAPFVPTVFRMLAVHEDYLAAIVDAVCASPAERRASYTRRCGELAAAAAIEFDPTPLSPGNDAAPVAALIERYSVANPSGLLVLTALAAGLEPARGVLDAPLPERGGRPLAEDILACHGGFTVPGFWRELAHSWPDLAERAWAEIRTVAQAPRFAAERAELIALAAEALPAGALPRPAAALRDRDAVRDAERIVAWFARAIPSMVLEIECLRLALDRGVAQTGSVDPPQR